MFTQQQFVENAVDKMLHKAVQDKPGWKYLCAFCVNPLVYLIVVFFCKVVNLKLASFVIHFFAQMKFLSTYRDKNFMKSHGRDDAKFIRKQVSDVIKK